MEIWLSGPDDGAPIPEGFDGRFTGTQPSAHLWRKGDRLMRGNEVVGAALTVTGGEDQHTGIETLGLVEWLLVEFTNWSMIPLENLIAHAEQTPTKIAAVIDEPMQAQGAGFALERGVNALVVANKDPLLEAALSVKAQRTALLEQPLNHEQNDKHMVVNMTTSLVEAVEPVGIGERYCLDFISLFNPNEGVLVGSSANALVLVHSETIASSFVPTRPFRVNAGSPHSYLLMADGRTKYISELTAGDEVAAVATDGGVRTVVLGRLKIEQRPMLKVTLKHSVNNDGNPYRSHVFMQQAETVRLVSHTHHACSVTSLDKGHSVLTAVGGGGRHIGVHVSTSMEER